MPSTWKIALVSAASAVTATAAVVAVADRGAEPATATVPPGDDGGSTTRRSERSVAVTGHGTVDVRPDIAHVSMGVLSAAPDGATVYTTLEAKSTALVDTLKGLGVAEADIQTTGLNIYPNYGDNNEINGYQGSVDVQVTVREIARIGEVLDGVQGFVGPELTLGGISFSSADPEAALGEARQAAIANAKVRAEQFAGAADATVGEVLEIVETTVPDVVFGRLAAEGDAGGASPDIAIEPGSQELAVDVTVVFELT